MAQRAMNTERVRRPRNEGRMDVVREVQVIICKFLDLRFTDCRMPGLTWDVISGDCHNVPEGAAATL